MITTTNPNNEFHFPDGDYLYFGWLKSLTPLAECQQSDSNTKSRGVSFPEITKVLFNDPATIVWFGDGTKAIVKKSAADEYSKEHALLYAIAKRLFGTVMPDGEVKSDGFMTYLKRLVENGIDQPELARKVAEAKKAKKANKNNVPANHPKTKKVETTDSSSKNSTTHKYYSKKSNSKKD